MPFGNLFSARSSSASHFSDNYLMEEEDEAAKWIFHGVELNNDISDAPTQEIVLLVLLILFLLTKNRLLGPKTGNSLPLWATVFAITYPMKNVIWVPLLSTILYTRTSYPYLVVFPHCIVACCAYRSELERRSLEPNKPRVHPISSFTWSFLCYGFGGSIVSDWLLGLPITALGHERILFCHTISYMLVWYSPLDWCYQEFMDTSSFWRFALSIGECVDSITTPPGRISRGARELKNQVTAPLMGGMLAGVGGSWIRYGERTMVQGLEGEDPANGPSISAMEAGFWNTIFHSLLWWYYAVYSCNKGLYDLDAQEEVVSHEHHCASFAGSDNLRFGFVISAIIWTSLNQTGLISSATKHPFIWLGQDVIAPTWKKMTQMLSLGPQYEAVSTESDTKTVKKE